MHMPPQKKEKQEEKTAFPKWNAFFRDFFILTEVNIKEKIQSIY